MKATLGILAIFALVMALTWLSQGDNFLLYKITTEQLPRATTEVKGYVIACLGESTRC